MGTGGGRNWFGWTARMLVVLVIFVIIGRQLDLRLTADVLRRTAPGPVLFALALFLLNRLLNAVKWDLLLRKLGIRVPLGRLVRIVFESGLLGILVPTGLGADIARLFQLNRERADIAAATGSILTDRLLSVVTLATMSICAVTLSWAAVEQKEVLLYVAGAGAILIVAIFFFMGDFTFRLLTGVYDPFFSLVEARILGRGSRAAGLLSKARRKAETVHSSFGIVVESPALLAKVLGLNLIVQLVRVGIIHSLFVAVGHPVPVAAELTFVPIILMILFLPFMPYMGLGVKEAAFIFFFGKVGVPGEVALSASILTHLVIIAGTLTAAPLFLFRPAERPTADADREGGLP